MGQNLALNLCDNNYKVSVYNRTPEKTDLFLRNNENERIIGMNDLSSLVQSLKSPRKIILMIQAGSAIDKVIAQLTPLLESGDIIIDGGNSFFQDTTRRTRELKKLDIHFIGMGISGGEEGARYGPSIMPGGDYSGWMFVKDAFNAVSAKAKDGQPCCAWIGEDGAGHYVKMVHNGIEYADMQLISEAYVLLKDGLNLKNDEIAEIFGDWNNSRLESYLIEITSIIFTTKDKNTNEYLIDVISDEARQKGTGKWTAISALDLGVPAHLISDAVFQRYLSSLVETRSQIADLWGKSDFGANLDNKITVKMVANALYLSKLIAYDQGFKLMKVASENYGWNLNLGEIAMLWRAGCIIRSRFLEDIKEAFEESVDQEHLILHHRFMTELKSGYEDWKEVVKFAIERAISIPGLSAAIAYFNGLKSLELPSNLIQAQRDFFGAHGFKRRDQEGDFHHNWT